MRPVGQNIRENRLSETQPMRPVSIRTADSRPGYSTYRNAYRQTIERRASGSAHAAASGGKQRCTFRCKGKEDRCQQSDGGAEEQSGDAGDVF